MNNIFLLTAEYNRILNFYNYYNIFNKKTQTKINIIIDDRIISKNDIIKIQKLYTDIYFVSDIIESLIIFFDSPDIVLEILKKYGVSIKWLLFIFIGKILKIKKSMLIDDDTLLIKPIDFYFKYDYVIKKDNLASMTDLGIDTAKKIVKFNINEINEKRLFINSGQMIHTWKNEGLLKFMNNVFSIHMLNFINKGIKKTNNFSLRNVNGKYWIIEQYMYAIYFYSLKNVHKFKSDIQLYTYKIKEIPKNKKLPNFIHYLPKDKEPFYKYYLPFLDNKIKEHI